MSKQFILLVLSTVFIIFGSLSCTSDTKSEEEVVETAVAEDHATKTQTSSTSDTNRQYLIEDNGIEGVIVGGFIEKIADRLEDGEIKTSEGVFSTYNFKSKDGHRLGYFLPDPQNKYLIGDIVIRYPNAVTSHGIKVGSTFAELKAAAPNVEVHGSEIDGRTTATVGNIGFVLRAAFHTYEVDEAQIEPDTKILRVMIMRQAKKQ